MKFIRTHLTFPWIPSSFRTAKFASQVKSIGSAALVIAKAAAADITMVVFLELELIA
jgi:hypothetical protein